MTHERTGSGTGSGKSGFSLLEVLIAAVILMVIALGLVPLYSRSIRSNLEGFDYTQVSNLAKSRAEEHIQLPFDDPRLTVPGGSTEASVDDFYSARDKEWVLVLDDGDSALFDRTTTVRQFSVGNVTEPLDGNAPPEAVHLKEITVAVRANRAGAAFGPGKAITVRVFKSH